MAYFEIEVELSVKAVVQVEAEDAYQAAWMLYDEKFDQDIKLVECNYFDDGITMGDIYHLEDNCKEIDKPVKNFRKLPSLPDAFNKLDERDL